MTDFLLADSGIRQLHARFCDAVWRQDAEAFANCFAENGEWKIAGMHICGRAEIGSLIAKFLAACERVLVMPSIPLLEVGDGSATGRLHLLEFAKMRDGSSALTVGVYYDRYVEEGGAWRFQWRHFALHYRGPTDLSETLVESPDYGPPPALPGTDEPTFTRRKL